MDEIAILMAAGFGKRMLPLTKDTPKPLIPVHGTPMVETVIQGLLSRPVGKIYIVTGYLGEQFKYLEEKYSPVEIVANKEYAEKNNISSIHAVGERLGSANCFICEADLWVQDSSIFKAELTRSCYYGKKFSGYLEDWIFELKDGRIIRVKKGGSDTYRMVGISYFLQKDAAIVRDGIQKAYQQPGHEQLFWDEIVDQNLNLIDMGINPVQEGRIVELDTVKELREAEARYEKAPICL